MRKLIEKYSIYILYGGIFVFFSIIFGKIPLIHDAWAGQIYNNSSNFIEWMESRFNGYFTLNGRIIAQTVVGFFERNEFMLDISNAIFMTMLIAVIVKVLKKEKQIFFIILTWGLLLLTSVNIRTEVYFYATMIYIIPALLFFLFMYFFQIIYYNGGEDEKKNFYILCILGILNSGWIEHSGFAFVFIIGIYWIIDLIKNKRINVKFTLFELLNVISFCILAFSPGLRLHRVIVSSEPINEIVINNIGKTVQAVMYDHKLVFLFLIIICIISMNQIMSKKKNIFIYKTLMVVYGSIFFINIIHDVFKIKLFEVLLLNADVTWKFGKSWSFLGIILIILIFIPLLYNSRRNELVFSYFIGIFSLVPTIVSPNFGYRICFFPFVTIIFLIIGLVADIKLDRKEVFYGAYIIVSTVLFIQIDSWSILVANINKTQNQREEIIQLVKAKQNMREWDYNKMVILPKFTNNQLYAMGSPEPYFDPVHHEAFMEFYGLDPMTLLLFSDYDDELRIILDGDNLLFELIPEHINNDYEYIYYIMSGNEIIWESEQTKNLQVETIMQIENQNYYFKCDMINKSGEIREIYAAKVINY